MGMANHFSFIVHEIQQDFPPLLVPTMASVSIRSKPRSSVSPRANLTSDCYSLDAVYNIQNDLYWKHINSEMILSLYAVVCAIGFCLNLLVIIAFFMKLAQLGNLRNYFIMNLAVSDLLLCLITAPATLYLTLNLFWPFGNPTCQIVASIQAVNLFVSCLTLVLIAMDRFLLTLFPVTWRLAAKAPIICYAIVWLTSVLVAAPYFFAISAEDVTFNPWDTMEFKKLLLACEKTKPQICIEKTWDRLPFSRKTYTLTVLTIQYILPLGALGFAYSQIGSTIRRREKTNTTVDGQRRQILTNRNRKAMLLLFCLVIVYGIAWLPMNAYNVLNVLDVIEFSQHRYIFCHLIGMCSTCLNPILYAMINDSFRNSLFSLLQPLFTPCTKYITIRPHQQNQLITTYSSAEHIALPNKKISFSKKDSEVRLIGENEVRQNGNVGHRSSVQIYDPIDEGDEDEVKTQGSTHL